MFAERLKALRKAKGITQVQFANDFHIANGTIGMWESGRREPDFETAQRIADYFNVTVDYLLGRDTQKAPTPEGERPITDDDLKFALWGNASDIDEDDLEDVRRYAAFVAERKKKKP